MRHAFKGSCSADRKEDNKGQDEGLGQAKGDRDGEKGQVRESYWRQTQPDHLRNQQGDFSALSGREKRMKRTESHLLVVVHIGDLRAVPLLEGVRGLHRPVNVVDAIGSVIVSGKCKKS